jgi:hypothetical protein
MQRDIILPEAFARNLKSQISSEFKSQISSEEENSDHDDSIQYVAIKLLHHGPPPNYIIRPGQEIEISNFHSNDLLKKVYIHMKALKDLLNVGAKSYFMKKVVLCPEFIAKSKESTVRFDELLFEALSHRDLRGLFEKKINYKRWEREIRASKGEGAAELNEIPLSFVRD